MFEFKNRGVFRKQIGGIILNKNNIFLHTFLSPFILYTTRYVYMYNQTEINEFETYFMKTE